VISTTCSQPAFDDVYCEGIRAVDDFDVATAEKLGFSIKLLGITSKVDGAVMQRVHPAMIPKDTALGSTHGVLNGLFTMGNFVGPTFSQGAEAVFGVAVLKSCCLLA
jgi:homoserine dehydrogenase